MKKFDLQLDTDSPDKKGDQDGQGNAPPTRGPGLALNLDLMKKTDQIADMKEKLYDGYDASSSRKNPPVIGMAMNKPAFRLNMAGITGEAPTAAPENNAPGEETISGSGAAGQTPSGARPAGRFAALADNVSNVSASPLNAGQMSSRFRARMGAGGIPTPLGSDMSRAKFDFSGYDPAVMRKQKEPSPERNVIIITKVEEDMEVFMSDTRADPGAVDLNKRNEASAAKAREQVVKEMFSLTGEGDDEQGKVERLIEV